jgi:paired amphipathic helix protein Sin3a
VKIKGSCFVLFLFFVFLVFFPFIVFIWAVVDTLNDVWVSFPTSEGEESAFLATKKNPHEEALFRCEDERFELDIVLEANLATIRTLELTLKHIHNLPLEQQRSYKLPPLSLGGDSEIIHRKVSVLLFFGGLGVWGCADNRVWQAIARLYGDHGEEVVAALVRDPVQHIPVVLKRLKQKNVEWRTQQRQWNLIWRDVHEKNYLKSLDYKVALSDSFPLFKKRR